ncbi:hypothetical protein Nepgr_000283 [Nepenthes gracilis]|uniref:Uncharacterized protein n=1 Tax=Nepenthes gracilis TaxID=150966 RepID=A0AAD3RW49_NEPGR|nr:hypothetical protein Nepgr_000283 [Nepenthes gracilis]
MKRPVTSFVPRSRIEAYNSYLIRQIEDQWVIGTLHNHDLTDWALIRGVKWKQCCAVTWCRRPSSSSPSKRNFDLSKKLQ